MYTAKQRRALSRVSVNVGVRQSTAKVVNSILPDNDSSKAHKISISSGFEVVLTLFGAVGSYIPVIELKRAALTYDSSVHHAAAG